MTLQLTSDDGADPSTTLFLSSPRSHPIALRSCLDSHPLVASYPLIHGPTETYITPHSIAWTTDGTSFLTGSDSLISLFDASRNGQEPISSFPTIPSKRKKIVGGGVGIKGIVSALALSCDGILAAGTFTRQLGLYDRQGSGDCIAVFPLARDVPHSCENDSGRYNGEGDAGRREGGGSYGVGSSRGKGGGGITQLLWSPCGRYLYAAERKSDEIICYDIRVTRTRLASLTGRNALTNQRLAIDLLPTSASSSFPSGSSLVSPAGASASTSAASNSAMKEMKGTEGLDRHIDGEEDNTGATRDSGGGGIGGGVDAGSYGDHEIWAGGIDGIVRMWKGPPLPLASTSSTSSISDGSIPPRCKWKVSNGMVYSYYFLSLSLFLPFLFFFTPYFSHSPFPFCDNLSSLPLFIHVFIFTSTDRSRSFSFLFFEGLILYDRPF